MLKLCFATQNPNKIREIQARLQAIGSPIELVNLVDLGCTEELAEDFETLEENAFQKAEYVAEHYGVSCFADDTGLEVEILDGAPGVYSARYAGNQKNSTDNITLLLQNLEGKTSRSAQFRTVIALIFNGKKYRFDGVVKGNIIKEPRGTDGFGYDPIFVPDGYETTFAEMPLSEKNQISHRAKALDKLIEFLKTQG